MCGHGKCIYYGCDTCLRYLRGEIIRLHRDECDCLNDLCCEFCSQECLDAYKVDCHCGSPNEAVISRGASQK